MSSNTVTFGANAKDYFTVTKQMQDELDKLAQKVNRFGGATGHAGTAAAHGFGRLAGDIIDVGTGTTGAVRRVTALNHVLGTTGAVAAVAGFALVEGFSKAADAASEYREQLEKINQPTGTSAFLGASQIGSRISEASAKLEELRERDTRESSGPAGELLRIGRIAKGAALGQGTAIDQDTQEETDKINLRTTVAESVSKLAEKQRALNDAEREGFSGSERQSELDKARIANQEKLGALGDAEKLSGSKNTSALEAENERYNLQVAAINKKHDALERELTLKEALLRLDEGFVDEQSSGDANGVNVSAKTSVLGAGQRGVASLLLKKQGAENYLKRTDLTDNQRRKGEDDRDTIGDQLDRAAYAEHLKGPAARSQEQRDEQKFQNFRDGYARNLGLTNIHRDFDGSILSGTDAAGRTVHPLDQLAQKNAEKNQPNDKRSEGSSVVGKIDHLITTLNSLPAKIGVI